MKLTLKDGKIIEFDSPKSCAEIAAFISEGLARVALAAEVDGKVVDLSYVVDKDAALSILTFSDETGRRTFRHTASHILAQAVKRLYPEAKLAIGPAIENGFYYDFDTSTPFTTEDLNKIEIEMKSIIKSAYPLIRFTKPREEAISYFEEKNEPYKAELIRDLPENEVISFYQQGEFTDLCAGAHLPNTSLVKAFKLTSSTGAYWRGDSKNKMLCRIYGTAYPKASQLEEYLTMLEEAKKRDHRRIGYDLDLFDIYDEGPGFPFFLPKGMVLRNQLESFWRERHTKAGYQEIRTPIILDEELWHRSGHWDHYHNNMYFTTIDEGNFAIKPMNCPGGMLVYKRKTHSYRDLPQRIAEMGLVHRHELSGALHGLMRVRCFTQDDAHIFMTPEQIESEILGVIELIDKFYAVFGFEYHVELSTRPENSMGSDEQWQLATASLQSALEKRQMEFKINEGDGAFYGPKIDFHLKDCLGRTWQCGTIQLDFQMPERFDLSYIGPDGEKHRPVMIHRVVLGSIERFIAILTEHFAGAFPIWLSPVQIKVLPISEKLMEKASEIQSELIKKGFRVELDNRNEKIGYKIREAQNEKAPYMLIIGQKEADEGTVSVRSRSEGDVGSMTLADFVTKISTEIENLK